MAKDKERLPKGADEKAITFQRAVFIVCNLKRLLKKPKKDEKLCSLNALGGSSRKRSSGAQNEDDAGEQRLGHRRSRKFRDPVRRAFTLPTILCKSLSVAVGNQVAADSREQKQLGACDHQVAAAAAAAAVSMAAATASAASGQSSSLIGATSATHRRLSPVELGAHPSRRRPAERSVLGQHLQRPSHRLWSRGELISTPISCLVTPIRRAATPNRATPNQNSSAISPRAQSSRRISAQASEGVRTISSQQQTCCPVWLRAMDQLDARQGQPRDQSSTAHLIGPPSRESHLPAPQHLHSAGRVHGESAASPSERNGGQVLVALPSAPSSGAWVSARRSSSNALRRSRRGRSSRKFASRNAADDATNNSDHEDHEKRADEDEDDDGASIASDLNRESDDQRLRAPHLLDTGELDDPIQWNHSTSPDSDCCGAGSTDSRRAAPQQLGQSPAGIKRFSSQSCLDDTRSTRSVSKSRQLVDMIDFVPRTPKKQPKQRVSVAGEHLTDAQDGPAGLSYGQRHRQSTASIGLRSTRGSLGGRHTSGAKMSTASDSGAGCLAPDDLMILARRRRPSVSNQGSVNVDQQALFSAVECNQLERAKVILEDGKVDVNRSASVNQLAWRWAKVALTQNLDQSSRQPRRRPNANLLARSLNGDKLTCLDIGVLMRNFEMVKLLQQHGAKESSAYLTYEGRANQLYSLYIEARGLVEDLSRSLRAIAPPHQAQPQQSPAAAAGQPLYEQQSDQLGIGSLLSNALLEEKQRQLQYWKRRLYLFMQMRYEFERLLAPNPPELIILQVVGERSLGVKIVQTLRPVTSATANTCLMSNADVIESNMSLAEAQARRQQLNLWSCPTGEALHCAQGPRCTHWYLSEFPDLLATEQLKHQHRDSAMTGERIRWQSGGDEVGDVVSGGDATRPPASMGANRNNCGDTLNALAAAGSEQREDTPLRRQQQQQQQRLVVFNQLLTQQLILLSNQQRNCGPANDNLCSGDAGDQCAERRRSDGLDNSETRQQQPPAAATSRNQMMLLAQHRSTETACDSSGTKHSSFVSDNLEGPVRGERLGDLEPSHSLAYRLMAGMSRPSGQRCGDFIADALLRQQQYQLAPVHSQPMTEAAGNQQDRMVITKYKVEWSLSERMDPIVSSMIVYSCGSFPLECRIDNLVNGQTYFVQVSAGNHRGFSRPKPTNPICLSPSSWRQVDGNKRRKYDEEVFRKFTKLILLNKHILDEHQPLSNHQFQQQVASLYGGQVAIAAPTTKSKSSLINMLLLDATTPTGAQLRLEHRLTPDERRAYPCAQDQEQPPPGMKVRKNFKNLFQSSTFKFHKLNNQNKRGLYLATVIYHAPSQSHPKACGGQRDGGITAKAKQRSLRLSQRQQQQQPGDAHSSFGPNDKIVVTNDDRLPVIEVFNDLVAPSSLMADFYWLLKINGTRWMDIKRIRQQLQKSHSSSTLHLRIKLLAAIEQMQLALNIEDIGRLFYKPIQAHDGSIVICTCRHVHSTKLVTNLSIKWTHQYKIIPRHLRKISETISETISSSSREQQQQEQCRQWRARETSVSSSSLKVSAGRDARADSSSALLAATSMLPATSLNPYASGNLDQQSGGSQQQTTANAAAGLVASSTAAALALSNSAKDSQQSHEFRMCDYCQHSLIQYRCTMASGSSSSSIASNESQRSSGLSGVSAANPGLGAGRCSCGHRARQAPSSSAGLNNQFGLEINTTTTGTGDASNYQQQDHHYQHATPAHQLYPPASQRSSSSTRSGSGAQQAHGGAGSTPTAGGSMSSTRSQSASQHFNGPQRASTYLMLAALSLYDLLLYSLNEIVNFDRKSTVPLNRGLYLGFVQLQTTVESMRLLVPRARPNMVPCARIRDNAHVSREEWQLLRRFADLGSVGSPSITPTQQQSRPRAAGGKSAADCGLGEASGGGQGRDSLGVVQVHADHSSDPSIWSSDASYADDPCAAAESLGDRLRCESWRSRAKSVSPGLLKDAAGDKHCACISSERIGIGREGEGAASSRKDGSVALMGSGHGGTMACEQSMASHSDTDLNGRPTVGAHRHSTTSGSSLEASNVDAASGAEGSSHCDCEKNIVLVEGSSSSDDDEHTADQTKTRESHTDGQGTESISGKRLASSSRQQLNYRSRSPTSASRLTVNSSAMITQSPEETFVRLVGSAARRLLSELSSQLPQVYDDRSGGFVSILAALNEQGNNRIYHVELIELSCQVTVVLLIPTAENVCPVTSYEKSNILADNKDYMLLPLQIFETIHIGTYEPDLLGKYSRLSAILETNLIVAQHDHRQAFSSNELKSTKSRMSNLQDMVSIADEFWRQLRWIVDVVSFARDKSASGDCIKISTIWRYFEFLSPSLNTCHDLRSLSDMLHFDGRQEDPEPQPQFSASCLRSLSPGERSGRRSSDPAAPADCGQCADRCSRQSNALRR